MTSWRSYAFDLRLLSNGVLLYPMYFGMGFLAYFSQLGEIRDVNTVLSIPLLALSLCVLTHIANERADKVADQIVLEHGGYKRRLIARIFSTLTYNTCLIGISFAVINLVSNRTEHVPIFWLLSAGAVILVFSTAGVIVAGAVPHPIISVAITMALLFAGGLAPTDAYQASGIIGMVSSVSLASWFGHFWPFAALWSGAASLCLPLALGRRRFAITRQVKMHPPRLVKTANWVSGRSTFFSRTFFTAKTNLLPQLALLISLLSYTYSSLLVAAKYSELNIQGELFTIFPGLILVNIVPAVLLAKSVLRVEVIEQESFLFTSQGEALRARLVQTSAIAIFVAIGLLTAIATLTQTAYSSQIFLRSLLVMVVATPGLCAIGLLIGDKLKASPLVAVASFVLTLPEFLIAKFSPNLDPWLPSSIFSALAGGAGPYIHDPSSIISFAEALIPTISTLGFAFVWIIMAGRRSTMRPLNFGRKDPS